MKKATKRWWLGLFAELVFVGLIIGLFAHFAGCSEPPRTTTTVVVQRIAYHARGGDARLLCREIGTNNKIFASTNTRDGWLYRPGDTLTLSYRLGLWGVVK